MQRKKPKRSLQLIRLGAAVRSKKGHKPVFKQGTENPITKKFIATGLFALKLNSKHHFDVSHHIDPKECDSLQSVLNDIVPVYQRCMELIGVKPIAIEQDAFFPQKLLSDMNTQMLNHLNLIGYDPIQIFKVDGHLRLYLVEQLDVYEQFNVLAYNNSRKKLKGKYLKLFNSAMKSLIFKCAINDWNDIYHQYYSELEWSDVYYEDPEGARSVTKTQKLYEHGKAFTSYESMKNSEFLTDDHIKRFLGDGHPVVGFAADVLDLISTDERVGDFSRSIFDDSHHGYDLPYHEQFMIAYEFDQVFDAYEEHINNIADNDGVEQPSKAHLLTSDMASIPQCGKESFPAKIYDFFDKWSSLPSLLPDPPKRTKKTSKGKPLIELLID